MKERPRAHELANDFVNDEFQRKRAWDFEDMHQMEKCGCPSCLQSAQSLQNKLDLENRRPPAMDHEEKWNMNQALKRLQEMKHKRKSHPLLGDGAGMGE